MEIVIHRERLHVTLKHDFFPDADALLNRLEQMEWKNGQRREHKDYGDKGAFYDLKLGGYSGYPYTTIHREVTNWENEPLLLNAKNNLPTKECNYCIVQRYKDGSIGMNRHKDNEMEERPIYGLSLGATRTLVLYPPSFNSIDKTPVRIPLPHNSLYTLLYPTNKYWMHCIEEDTSIKDVRYSITFRKSK